MSKTSDSLSDDEFEALVTDIARQTDAASTIIAVSTLEDWLTAILKAKLSNLSSKLEERLFRGYGPLSTFSAKIDIGYALELYDAETYTDLRALKDIRNEFAHTSTLLFFDSPALESIFQPLKGWTKGVKRKDLFHERVNACVTVFKKQNEAQMLLVALKNYRANPNPGSFLQQLVGASPDKSEQPQPHRSTAPDGSGARG